MKGQDGSVDHPHGTTEEGLETKVKAIGIDLTEDVFGVHGVDAHERWSLLQIFRFVLRGGRKVRLVLTLVCAIR
jgi:hypothetical protein